MKAASSTAAGFSRTVGALAALGAGFALGIAVHGSSNPWLGRLLEAITVIGQLWVSALRMTVLPLVISMTLVAIVGPSRNGSIGALGVKTLALFIAMLLAAGLLTLAVTASATSLYPVDAETAASFRARTSAPEPALETSPPRPTSAGDWLVALIPTNIFEAAAKGQILPILLFTVLVGLAMTRLAPEPRELLHRLVGAFSDAMMVLVRWILKFLPLGVFALSAEFAFRVGVRATGVVTFFVVLLSGILLLVTVLLYPVTAVLGRVSLAKFARAVAPAQVVAVSTRSSLASLPALVEGGRRHLQLPDSATGFVLPLSVATFELNRTISSVVRLLFLAHLLKIPLGLPQLASFLLTQLIMSFTTAGIPSVGSIRSLPAYFAAGIPIEGVLMLNAVDTIPDIFATLANVTADMSAATILSRRDRVQAAVRSPAGAATS